MVLSYRRGATEERNFWKRTLEDGNQTADDLIYAQKLMDRHDAIADTIERARHYGDIARDALAIFPDGPYKSALARSRRFLRRPRLLSSLARGHTLMPFVSIRILAGHKQETKDRIAKGTVKAITEATGLPDEAVWVVFEDVTGEDWFVGQKTVASLKASGKL